MSKPYPVRLLSETVGFGLNAPAGPDWKVLRVGNKHLIVVKGRRGRRRFAYTPATEELRPLSGK